MSPNEIAQWIVLGAIALMMVALYRQFGLLMMGNRSIIESAFGPALDEYAGDDLLELFPKNGRSDRIRLLVFVKEGCPLCQETLRAYAMGPVKSHVSLAVVAEGSWDWVQDLRELLPDVVVEEIGRLFPGEDRPMGYPFALVISSEGVVLSKELGGRVVELFTPDSDEEHHHAAPAGGIT